ncbi:PREDICTED: cytochrome c oxidase subunit 6b-1-like [Nicotiana attenuata]|uniref:Cytochrome c oxidase subunit 6b-1 n=1 Tax=Nicotiana attenuata TaxID=49451 RepID=A0A1J6ISZ3_NICAT|nr:PREDICTED: cytochrome c oxidase subunit 6b-1-like [Nicotiana attenuata]OIT07380.1 cytochrome c oxidase subunit 6b-1 [Nicotiana attenuata]
MAEVDNSSIPSLSEQYLLKEKEEKSTTVAKPVEETEVKASSTAPSEEDTSRTEETPVFESSEVVPAAPEESSGASDTAAPEINEASPPVEAASEESIESNEDETSGNGDQESADETPEIKLETAPADFRFPTTNQTRHCFTRYVEYHRCIAAKGEGAPECDKFAKYYRSLCPGEWIDRWNEQRENGTFPGPM